MPVYSRKVKNKKNPDGTYSGRQGTVYDVNFTYLSGGEKKTYAKRGFTDKAEALEHEATMRLEFNNQGVTRESLQKSKMLLSEYLRTWEDNYTKSALRPNSQRGYKVNIENHIIPEIGHLQLKEVTTPVLDEFYRKLLKQYAPNTVKYIHSTLNVALEHALAYRYITYNPARNIITKFSSKVQTPEPYSIDEMAALLSRVKGSQWEFIIMLGGLYGLRRNEILGLTKPNINLQERYFRVSEQLAVDADSETDYLAEVKEKASERILPITDFALPFFERQIDSLQDKFPDKSIQDYTGLVVCTKKGTHLSATHISRDFGRIAEDAGIRKIRFHDLRHTAATNMHELTGDFFTVGEILGHSLKGLGNQLGMTGSLEAVTTRYVDVRLKRKRIVLDTYHKEIKKSKKNKHKSLER